MSTPSAINAFSQALVASARKDADNMLMQHVGQLQFTLEYIETGAEKNDYPAVSTYVDQMYKRLDDIREELVKLEVLDGLRPDILITTTVVAQEGE